MRKLLRIALRYLRGYSRRYVFVLIVLGIGFAFISIASSLSKGMEESVTKAALRHYNGHLFVVGWDKQAGSMMVMDDREKVREAVARASVPVERIVRRTQLHTGAEVIFQGNVVRLKDLFGVDFEAEADILAGFDYAAGSFDSNWDNESIIISKTTAEQLRAKVGDRVTVRLENRRRQVDTQYLIVRAVAADTSIYGYARAYMARKTLTTLMDLQPADYSVMGIFLPDMADAPECARRVRDEIAKTLPVAGPIESKEDLTTNIRKRWEGVRYFTIPLQVYISEVTDLLTAMEVAAYGLLLMIMLVVAASVVVTYRVVLHDRKKELGTMLALGFPRYWIVLMLLTEAVILIVAGVVAGMVLSLAVTHALSFLSFEWIPGFELFMEKGRLQALYTAPTVAVNILIVLGAVVPIISVMVASLLRKEIPSLIKGALT